MLKHRVITAAVGVPLAILAIEFGDPWPWFSILIAASALVGTYEFYHMANFDRREPLIYLGLLWTLALVLSPHYSSPDVLPIVITATMLAVKAIKLICSKIADAITKGKAEAFSEEVAAVKLATEEGREEAVEILGSYTFEPEKPEEPKEPEGESAPA